MRRRLLMEPLEERVLLALTTLPGDFNGDGRIESMVFDSTTRNLTNAAWQNDAGPEPATWGQLPADTWDNFHVGDFNGDGRDDIAARNSSDNLVYLMSEGNRFQVLSSDPVLTATVVPWSETYVGDFDGDGSDELLGWYPTVVSGRSANRWEVMHYDERTGFKLDTGTGTSIGSDWGNAIRGVSGTQTITVGDVNRDGRDDLVARQSASTSAPGSWHFQTNQPRPERISSHNTISARGSTATRRMHRS